MYSFERARSGIPTMDEAFDDIRFSDNVVWQVSDVADFRPFAVALAEQTLKEGRRVVYFRFASHEPLIEEREGVKICGLELSHRFEDFTVQICRIIEEAESNTTFLFDSLSALQTAWSTDLMMGNFFCLVNPYIAALDGIGYYPVIRGRHSFDALARIQNTTQLFLDVFRDGTLIFVRPVKVWKRYTDTMFLLHVYNTETGEVRPATDGMLVSRFYQLMGREKSSEPDGHSDYWDRFFHQTRIRYEAGLDVSEECARMCRIMITRDERLRPMVEQNFSPEDYFRIRGRMIGTGLIGGKACGMLLSRKLIENTDPSMDRLLEPHDSWYVGSDVFYSYIVYNKYWKLRVRQRDPEGFFSLAETFRESLLNGKFSADLEEEFKRLLEYYGQDPYIVRSSSLLEDGYGNAFAGKYESVFCSNHGSMEQRLEEFENAVRTVYASSMSLAALDYRRRRGLDRRDEQMALLVQRVSGSRYGNCFMPAAAGVGYSKSPYRFGKAENEDSGMLRLVMGLGTMAVDRSQNDYPRLVDLADPLRKASVTDAERHQYSQRRIEAVDTLKGGTTAIPAAGIEKMLPRCIREALLSHDRDAERMFADRGQYRDIYYVSCDGLVKNKSLTDALKKILDILQRAYGCPVDIEYTVNIAEDHFFLNLLQCRPLQPEQEASKADADSSRILRAFFEPDTASGSFRGPARTGAAAPFETGIVKCAAKPEVFLASQGASMGFSRSMKLDYIVWIDPVGYYEMEYREKPTIARALGAFNWAMRDMDRKLFLFSPGRICTTSPELGVPCTFAEISSFHVICEVSERGAGYMPELSYGSHIFQDLVEAHILYTTVSDHEEERIFHPELLEGLPNHLTEYYPEGEKLSDIIKICDVSDSDCMLYYDMQTGRLLCTFGQTGPSVQPVPNQR